MMTLGRKVVAIGMVLAMMCLGAPTASAQTFSEGPDYLFSYSSYTERPSGNEVPFRVSWNLVGGATAIPYFINQQVIDAGFGDAVRAAFRTYEDDPGSDITFVYRGATNVRSEILTRADVPDDGINVVSFGSLQGSRVFGLGGAGFVFGIQSDGAPNGSGTGNFDITLTNGSSGQQLTVGIDSRAVDVESLVLHELGHALGLLHPSQNSAAVMWASSESGTIQRSLHPADRAGLAELYPAANPPESCDGRAITIDMTTGASGVGTAGPDVIQGTSGPDIIDGLGGNDVICGLGGDDVITGGDGDDRIRGGAGNDVIRGNAGVDIIDGEDGNDRLLGGIDGDTLIGSVGDDYLGGFGGADTIEGGPGSDIIWGGFGADQISGGDGADEIHGLIGDDVISGGNGADQIDGDRGNDIIRGGAGNDVIRGGNANDQLFGEAGNDNVSGGKADDEVSGGSGQDVCNGNKETTADVAFTDCEQFFGFP